MEAFTGRNGNVSCFFLCVVLIKNLLWWYILHHAIWSINIQTYTLHNALDYLNMEADTGYTGNVLFFVSVVFIKNLLS